jgi:hypothetical protein
MVPPKNGDSEQDKENTKLSFLKIYQNKTSRNYY